jgi:hypothetical protein
LKLERSSPSTRPSPRSHRCEPGLTGVRAGVSRLSRSTGGIRGAGIGRLRCDPAQRSLARGRNTPERSRVGRPGPDAAGYRWHPRFESSTEATPSNPAPQHTSRPPRTNSQGGEKQ